MRWSGQEINAEAADALPGLARLNNLVRTVQTPEFDGVTFYEVLARSALNHVPGQSAMPFGWTINPMRGCLHRCVYCFARPTHRYLDLDAGTDFDTQIIVKVNVAEVLAKEVAKRTWGRHPVALGTNTDPYQRAEGRYRLMPGIIAALAGSGTPLSILTKGTLLRRDLPLLKEASEHVPVDIAMSIAIYDEELQQSIEPGTPGARARLATVTAVRGEAREPFPHGALADRGTDTEAGLTVHWGVTPNVTLLGAVNPDFSQVEADSAQLEVNTEFALFYEEKRPFFLEGADFFSTPIQAVYTRTVADPAWGVKASGKSGREAFGVFVADDDATNLLLPGKDGSELTTLGASNLTGVARYRHDVGKNSTLGALVTAREGDGYRNGLVGLDGVLRIAKSDTVTFQVLRSTTEYPEQIRSEFSQPEGGLDGTAATVGYRHEDRNWYWGADVESFDRDFRADSGFVPQVDYREGSIGAQRTWWGGKDDWYSSIKLGGDWEYSEDMDGRHLESEQELFGYVGGPMQSHLETALGHRTRTYNGVMFDQTYGALWCDVRPSGALRLELGVDFGDRLDVANTRNGTVLSVAPEVTWRAGRHLNLSASYEHQTLDVEGGRLYTARLAQLRAVWQFSLRTFLRVITQYADVSRDPSLYLDEVSAAEEELFNQLLLSYKINPQTVFFVGYSDSAMGLDAGVDRVDLTTASRTVFVKLGYAWLP